MLQSHLDIALKNPEATQHEIEEKLLQKTKANIDSEHPDKGGLISKVAFFICPFYQKKKVCQITALWDQIDNTS